MNTQTKSTDIVNRGRLKEQVRRAMQDYYGCYQVDQDLADHIADRINHSLPEGVTVNPLHRIKAGDIINRLNRSEVMAAPHYEEPEGRLAIFFVVLAMVAAIFAIGWWLAN